MTAWGNWQRGGTICTTLFAPNFDTMLRDRISRIGAVLAMPFIVVLPMVFLAHPSAAQETRGKIDGWPTAFEGRQPVGMPPGEGWKAVSGDGSLQTSDCVGLLTSPECLLDTIMACEAWSRVDEITAVNTYGDEYYWHPVCYSLRGRPGVADEVSTFEGGSGNPEDFSYYYKTVSFALTVENTHPRRRLYPEGRSCSWCPGDVVVAFLAVICSPDPAIIGQKKDGWPVFGEFPDGSPLSYCVDWSRDDALITRQDEPTGLWRIVEPYRPGLSDGSGNPEGWPYLKRFYQGIR